MGTIVTEELDVLAIVTERLESAQMPYMVTGSFAANYYAVPRMTAGYRYVCRAVDSRHLDQLCELFQGDSTSTGTPTACIGN